MVPLEFKNYGGIVLERLLFANDFIIKINNFFVAEKRCRHGIPASSG